MSQSKTIAEPASPGLVAEGFRWLWNHELLRPMAIVLGLLNGLGMLSGAVLVLFAQQVLSTSATEFALLGTGGAIGGVIGGLVVTIAVATAHGNWRSDSPGSSLLPAIPCCSCSPPLA